MDYKIEDYITLPAVNQMIAEGTLSEKDAVKYITECAAAEYFEEMYDSSDDVVAEPTEDTTNTPVAESTEDTTNTPVAESAPIEPEVVTDNTEDDGIATGTEEDPK